MRVSRGFLGCLFSTGYGSGRRFDRLPHFPQHLFKHCPELPDFRGTSKLRGGALRGLRVAGLETEFDLVVGSDDVQHPKPHPEPVLKALERLGRPAAEAVFIGDSRHDLECGRAAGVRTAAVLWGPFGRSDLEDLAPDYWLERPQDLRSLTPDS